MYFIDKNIKKEVSISEWKFYSMITSDFGLPAQASIKCTLFDLWLPYPPMNKYKEISRYFQISKQYLCETTTINKSGTHQVHLYEMPEEKDLVSSLLDHGIGQRNSVIMSTTSTEYPYDSKILVGQTFLAYIIQIDESTTFFQPEPHSVDVLEQEIQDYLTSITSASTLNNHQTIFDQPYCLAKYNAKWYRAFIKHHKHKNVVVFLIDYGYEVEVSCTQVMPLNESLLRYCRKSIKCKVNNVSYFIPTEKTIYIVKPFSVSSNGILNINVTISEKNQYFPIPVLRNFEKVVVNCIEDDIVYMSRVNGYEEIVKLSNQIKNNINPWHPNINVGDVCILKDTYRVVIEERMIDRVNFRSIDYGFRGSVQETACLKTIRLPNYPGYSIQAKIHSNIPFLNQYYIVKMTVEKDGSLLVLFPEPCAYEVPSGLDHIHGSQSVSSTIFQSKARVTYYETDNIWIVPEQYFSIADTIKVELEKIVCDLMPMKKRSGMLCAACDSNENRWYRVLLETDLNQAMCVDTGKTFRMSSNPKKLPDSLEILPNCAIPCLLNTAAGDLSADVRKLSPTEIVLCEFEHCGRPPIRVTILNFSTTLNDINEVESSRNLRRDYGDKVNNEENQQKISKQKKNFSEEDIIQSNFKLSSSTCNNKNGNTDGNSLIPPGKVVKPNVGDMWTVSVPFYESLDCFYLQNQSNDKLLKWVFNNLQNLPSDDSAIYETKVDDVVAALDDNDKNWYRAKVVKISDNFEDCEGSVERSWIVTFIDYGNTKTTRRIRRMPAELFQVKPMGHLCYLKNATEITVVNELSRGDLYDVVDEYLSADLMSVKFHSKTVPYAVTLTRRGRDLLDSLNALIWYGLLPGRDDNDPVEAARRIALADYPLDGLPLVSVGPVYSIHNFYVEMEQHVCVKNTVNDIIKRTTCHKNIVVMVNKPTVGQLVIAKSQIDGQWYRARVLHYVDKNTVNNEVEQEQIVDVSNKVEDKKQQIHQLKETENERSNELWFKCYMLDLGIYEICSEFAKLDSQLLNIPPAKALCSLHLQKAIHDAFLDSVNEGFADEMTLYRGHVPITVHPVDELRLITAEATHVSVVDLRIDGLSMAAVIKPYYVEIHNARDLNAFVAQLVTPDRVKVAEVLCATKKFTPVRLLQPGYLYVAVHEGQYKRVRYFGNRSVVRNNSGDSINCHDVELVDEALQLITVDHLFALPKSIETAKTLAISCSLGVDKQYYCTQKFRDLCKNGWTKFTMVIVKHDDVNGHKVDLFRNFENIKVLIAADSV
ncbi:uncharacterized protein LOC126897755 isoform X2 [Daktulosphaira vitifoliae]|nr:uncharacterized protein LOC126897755 isoform X2 [Daktulosphaira vitifoliae]